ncbi:DNA-binding NarL/FixJ family response regulator [Aequitasia blattaphilus]|uniref:Stage 0 sporulation protein A homolog n=1 Tax=Aequitasia blattaphilus TaxID=2949332 RepID=A0ABT1E6A3_9FIRM|nr:response regulator transcription factor [Aequitasia blattaphilus]MCP1101283.1 response regulator transcription factor [Aequitasia blattaphilus]MCR8613923.1 response regulator transcription factor [Aequitasia blattaphilus]
MKILIVDDDKLVSVSLKIILEGDPSIEVVGIGQDGKDAIRLFREYTPDVLLMDIRMEEMDGLSASKEILETNKDAKILLLTTFSDDEYIIKALKYGVKGYLIKQDYENIIPAVHAVYSGQTVFGNEIVSKIPGLLQREQKCDFTAYEIGAKEMDIIRLVAQGLSNKEISNTLYLSEGTVRNYLSQILEKLNLRDRTQLAVFYLNNK